VDYGSFLKAVEQGRVPPVALLHGPEPLLLDDALTRVTRAVLPDPGQIPLSREVLEARDVGPEEIVRSALTLPFLSERRLVAVRGADGLTAKQAERLVEYIASPSPSTALLLLVDQELAASHWLLKAVPGPAIVAVPRPVGRAVVSWLRARSAADGLEIAEDAASLLVQLVGDDLTTLLGEVEKAALAAGPENRRVTVREVRAVVGEHRLRHIFELTRALERRDLAGALTVLGALLAAGEEPLGVLGMLTREARTVWQVKEAIRRGRSPDEIGRVIRRPAPGVAAMTSLAQTLSADAVHHRLVRCWEVERRLKSGSPPRPELALLIADLCAA
jgi:DNA polymerase-3 subunit delta